MAAGLDPIVHVSSTVVLVRYAGSGPDLPLGDIELPYAQSKIASEKVARRLQHEGSPVVTVYPGSVYGPGDPYRGDQSERLRWILLGRFPLWPKGGMHVTDVRDVATVIDAVLVPDRGPRRYVVPGSILGPSTRVIAAVQRRLPVKWHYPADLEGLEFIRRDTRIDDSATRKELDLEPTPLKKSLADTIIWLAESGRVSRRYLL